jgi:hypothetical protein
MTEESVTHALIGAMVPSGSIPARCAVLVIGTASKYKVCEPRSLCGQNCRPRPFPMPGSRPIGLTSPRPQPSPPSACSDWRWGFPEPLASLAYSRKSSLMDCAAPPFPASACSGFRLFREREAPGSNPPPLPPHPFCLSPRTQHFAGDTP